MSAALHTHLATGITTVARCWAITRRDGVFFGFTDHDLPLTFDDMTFDPATGLTAHTLHQTSGLAVDNTEAIGALSDDRINEGDINAGLFDHAQVRAWLVNWQDVSARKLQFSGTLGEIRRAGGAFTAELRGLAEALNEPQGRVYQRPCSAILGDAGCGFDLETAGYFSRRLVETITDRQILRFSNMDDFSDAWFERGRMIVETGAGKSITAWIKKDWMDGNTRVIELWEPIRADVQAGDQVLIQAGCDKRGETCRAKFNNMINFQGFPFIPGDDWLISYPTRAGQNDGGSLFS